MWEATCSADTVVRAIMQALNRYGIKIEYSEQVIRMRKRTSAHIGERL